MARLPNVPTVWSNVFTAWMLASSGTNYRLTNGKLAMLPAPLQLALALLGGTMLYVAGTLLSDLHDEGFDRQYRPERPIPSQRVSRTFAKWIAGLLIIAGNFALIFASLRTMNLNVNGELMVWPYGNMESTMRTTFALVMVILAYAVVHKRWGWLAAILMGLCRVLLGLAVMFAAWGAHWEVVPWLMALGLNVVGISWLARGESRNMSSGITCPVLLITLTPPAIALLSRSLWNGETYLWLGIALWGAAVWWLTQPLHVRVDGSARGLVVGRALAMLPILDAVFLMPVYGIKWAVVPWGCMVAALALRRVAAAT